MTSTEYSAHPDLASEQLQCTEQLAASHSGSSGGSSNHFSQHYNRRRHNSTGNGGVSGSCSSPAKLFKSTTKLNTAKHQQQRQQQQQQITSKYTNVANTEVLSSVAAAAATATNRPDRRITIGGGSNNSDDVNVDFVIAEANHNTDDNAADDDDDDCNDNTKDCVDCAPPPTSSIATTIKHNSPLTIAAAAAAAVAASSSFDETDYVQHRFSRLHHKTTVTTHCSSRQHSTDNINDGCASGVSSAISSPSASTASSPLSTPTRHAPHFNQPHHHQHSQHSQNCCQKGSTVGDAGAGGGGGAEGVAGANCGSAGASSNQHHPHQHHHILHHHTASSSGNGGCKNLQKLDPRLSPSPYRQLLPIVLCILSFATVFSILIVYMDTTEIRHQQFRLNMSRDYELYGVAQDDPTLIAFLREIHMRKYPMHFLKNARDTTSPSASLSPSSSSSASSLSPASSATAAALVTAAEQQHLNFSGTHYDGLTPQMAYYVANLMGGKMNGAVIQSLPGTLGHLLTAPWLSETLNWAGVIVEPEPRRYFALRKQNAQRARMQVMHACVSPNPYPKEVTIHNEDSEVRINSLLDEETSWFNSRVKCFPLYTIMLACNRIEYDLLSLGVHGHELEILQTLPFDKIKIEVISIHLPDDEQHYENNFGEQQHAYIQTITKFLMGKSYKMQKKFGRNYFYQRINTTTSRTRKKDIFLLKTP